MTLCYTNDNKPGELCFFADNSKVLHDLEPKHKAMLLGKISTNIPIKVGKHFILGSLHSVRNALFLRLITAS